jgi:hypothetical protein
MPGEGLGAVSAAVSYASSVFAYFSPTRSPHYATTVAAVIALCLTFALDRGAWLALYVPMTILLLSLLGFTIWSPKYWFSRSEYNDQLKFSRSLAVTSSIACATFLILSKHTLLGNGSGGGTICSSANCSFVSIANLIIYLICLAQIVLFLMYEFVFGRFDERVRLAEQPSEDGGKGTVGHLAERNYVQLSLVMSTYLAGMTTIVDYAKENSAFLDLLLALFVVLWLICGSTVLMFVLANFNLQRPRDVEPLLPADNVVRIKQSA